MYKRDKLNIFTEKIPLFRLTPEGFDTIRLVLVVVTVILRFLLMPVYLQAYLNLAYNRIEEQKKEAGRITNVELQKKVSKKCIPR